MADPRLEEYASGIGPGAYSPQQGSSLPASAQGGLPFGAQSPIPPRAPAPMAPFPRAPLASLGGNVPDVEQMIADRLKSVAAFNPAAKNTAQQEDSYAYAMHDLPRLSQVAATRSQDRQLQEKNLSELAALADKFHKDYDPATQESVRPIYQQLLKTRAQLAGRDMPDDVIDQALRSPNLAAGYSSIFNDPSYSPQERDQALALIGQGKDVKTREDVVALATKRKDQELTSLVQTHLPQVLQRMGASPEKPISGQQFMTTLEKDPEIGPALKGSPALRRNLNTFVTDKNNADTLASWGLKPGSVETKAMQGPELSTDVRDILGTIKGPDGKPLIPAVANSEQIKWATKAAQAYKVETASKQGLSVEEFKRTLPAPGEELSKYVDVNALASAGELRKPVPGTSVAALYSDKNLSYADAKQQEAVQALNPTRQQLATFQTMADRLITAKTPGEAATQGVRLYAGALTGSNPEAKAFMDSSLGFIGNLSRTLGGERGVLTDLDRQVMKNAAIASFWDTTQSKDIKKAIINDIYKSAHTSAVGSIAGTSTQGQTRSELDTLLKKLDEASRGTLKGAARADQLTVRNVKTGEVGFVPKAGYKQTEGWEVIK